MNSDEGLIGLCWGRIRDCLHHSLALTQRVNLIEELLSTAHSEATRPQGGAAFMKIFSHDVSPFRQDNRRH